MEAFKECIKNKKQSTTMMPRNYKKSAGFMSIDETGSHRNTYLLIDFLTLMCPNKEMAHRNISFIKGINDSTEFSQAQLVNVQITNAVDMPLVKHIVITVNTVTDHMFSHTKNYWRKHLDSDFLQARSILQNHYMHH